MHISPLVLAEYEKVLRRPKFKFPSDRIAAVLQLITRASVLLTELPAVTISPDEADNRFLECAEATGADFLVTGNARHFPPKWKQTLVVTARQLLEQIAPSLLDGTTHDK